jgi:hypothetical protein
MFFNAVALVYASTALLSSALASTTTSAAAAGATYEVSVGAVWAHFAAIEPAHVEGEC